jgi:hypothetical protein
MRTLVFVVAATLVTGCAFFPRQTEQRKLSDVVDAIQLAVDQVAELKPWEASEKEAKHWSEACTLQSAEASKQCLGMLSEADKVCRASCPGGACGYAQQELCRRVSVGEDREALCDGQLKGSPWCTAALACGQSVKDREPLCAAAKSVAVPELKQAIVTLATEESTQSKGEVKLMVVAFGGGGSRSATNTVSLALLPRVRSEKYQGIATASSALLPARPPSKPLSSEALALARDLKGLLSDAIKSVSVEYDKATGIAGRPPMALAGLDLEVALTITSDGSLGIEKAWSTPAGVELSRSSSSKLNNTLKLTFARAGGE